MKRKLTYPLEFDTRTKIDIRLSNLGWNLDEKDPNCNVFKGHPKTNEEQNKLDGNYPDYVLYGNGSNKPIAIIEAKKSTGNIDEAISQAIYKYAHKLNCPLVFASNDTFVVSRHVITGRPLKIDGEELQDFIDQSTALRFFYEGSEILSTPKEMTVSRDELLKKFKKANNYLREDGLRNGYERFSAFADVLFLKLFDESEKLREHQNMNRILNKKYSWSNFIQKNDEEMLDFINDSVWKKLKTNYGDLFKNSFTIRKATTLRALVDMMDFNLTSTDVDVKGDAFEFFLKNVTNGNKDLGEYFTPRHITRTVINLVKPKFGETIYDPFCGTGGFLVEAFKYMKLRISEEQKDNLRFLKEETIFGKEITSTARIAQMNLIMFDDGYSNIKQMDSLEHPEINKYDVVVTNIPYSQETKYGGRYDIPTTNADSICVQHVFKSLKEGGRAAIIVPETFLYKSGVIGKTRELILKNAKRLSVISLPRGVFLPYTPTKTNILYFEKGYNLKNIFFFVIQNDGFELNTQRKAKDGSSDIKDLLSIVDEPLVKHPISNIVGIDEINQSAEYNLRPFYYMEDIIDSYRNLISIEDKITEINSYIDPREEPDKEWNICEVSQQGVFLGDVKYGVEFTQNYKIVKAGNIVYNPWRVNIGSIGIIPEYLDGGLVSPAYVVFNSICDIPNEYILSILKHERYQKIIMNYSLSSARASLPFSELVRIKIPEPTGEEILYVNDIGKELKTAQNLAFETNQKLGVYSNNLIK